MRGGAPFIQVKNLTKRFGKKNVILDNISLDIPYGEIFGILGKSGSGKTTLLNLIIGFYKPTKGKVYFQGRDIFKTFGDIERRFGFSTQGLSFYSKLSVMENMYYFGRLYGLKKNEIKEKADELLKLVELDKAKKTLGENLSMGMQKRLDIACSLIHDPEILILDEPTQDLDPLLRKEILSLIKRINDKGTTILITSHLLGEIDYLCKNIAIINDGKVIKMESVSELMEDYSKNKVINLETRDQKYDKYIIELRKIKEVDHIITEGRMLLIHTPKPGVVIPRVLDLIKNYKDSIISFHLSKPSLEEVFEAVIKEDSKAKKQENKK